MGNKEEVEKKFPEIFDPKYSEPIPLFLKPLYSGNIKIVKSLKIILQRFSCDVRSSISKSVVISNPVALV